MRRRLFVKLMTVSVAAAATGCFGSFKATRFIYDINKGVGGKFLQWLVFLGFSIIPVYEVAVLVDVFILNSLEFWFDGGTASKQDDADERIVQLSPTQTLTLRKDTARGVLWATLDEPGRTLDFTFEMNEDGARLWQGDALVASARETADAGVEISTGDRVVALYDAATVRDLHGVYESGGAASVAAWTHGAVGDTSRHLASLR